MDVRPLYKLPIKRNRRKETGLVQLWEELQLEHPFGVFSEISALSYAVRCSRNTTMDRNGSCVKKAHPFGVFPTCREAAVEDDKAQNTFCL